LVQNLAALFEKNLRLSNFDSSFEEKTPNSPKEKLSIIRDGEGGGGEGGR